MKKSYLSLIQLISDYGSRQQWAAQVHPHPLLGERFHSLSLEALALAWEENAIDNIMAILPHRLLTFLERDALEPFVKTFLRQEPAPTTLLETLLGFLHFLSNKLKEDPVIIPHLQDVILYELSCLQTQQVQPHSGSIYPTLPTHVALLKAGPFLQAVLEEQAPVFMFSDSPKVPYLLKRSITRYELQRLPEVVYAVLKHCQGQMSWNELINTHLNVSELSSEEQALLAHWYHRLQHNDCLRVLSG